jgi:hypothetical protein
MKQTLSTFFAIALLALSAPAMAQGGPVPGEMEDPCLPGAARQIITDFLELDEDQVMQWDELIADRDAAAQPLREMLAATQAEIEVLLGQDDPDPYEVGDLVILRHDLGSELAAVQRTYVEGFETLLSEEQLDRYHFIRRAEQAQPLFVPFRIMDLLPPHWR